ncbi:reverse transcriptase domain-containing protein [Tanacetum coccineum]
MRTRSQSRRHRQQQTLPVVENFDLEEPIVEQNVVPMADNRTMAQMLQVPIEGYEDAIVVLPINANNFELKQPLINLVQSNKFTGRQDPHNHLRFFNNVTSTFRHPKVPNTSIKLLLFPFSLDGEARDWLDKEPPRSILTWDDLVSKFINQFFPPSKTTYYRNEIITFYQKPNETFNEAWETVFKGHFIPPRVAIFLDKMPQEGLEIIESKSKLRYSRSRANDSRVSTDAPLSNSSPSNNSFDMQQIAASLEDKMTIKMKQMMNEMKALVVTTPAPVKAVEEVCVTCGSNHHFNHCPLTQGGNDFPVFQDNIQQFQQTAAVGNFLQRNQPSNLASQMRPPGFNQPNVQNNQNRYQGNNFNSNQNRGGNFNQNRQNNQNQVFQPPTNQPPTYQTPTPQIQGVLKTDFENYVKANDAVLKNVQNQGQNLQNQMANVTSLTSALADSGASINLLPHSIYKKLELEALTPTRMTLELANRSITHPIGIAEDVVVRVDGFTFLADFVVVNFEPDPKVPIILGRPFLRTAKALIDLYEEKLTLRVGKEELVYFADKSEKNKEKNFKSENEAYLEIDSIPPGIDLTLPPTLEVSSSNPTSPTLTREKDLKKDLPIAFDSITTSILPLPLLDSDSPFTAELSASVTLNSLGNKDKVFKPGILIYHAIHDKNLVTLEKKLRENISSGTLLVFKEPSFLLPPPEPPDECLKNVVLNFYQSKQTIPLHVKDINTFTSIIWTFLPYFIYTEESPLIFSFRSENFIFDLGIVTFYNPVAVLMEVSRSKYCFP